MTKLPIILGAALVVVAIVIVLIKKFLRTLPDKSSAEESNDYALLPTILSPAERSFLGVLEPLLPADIGCFVKVRLGDVFVTRKGLDVPQRTRARNRINQKHVDFLLVRASDLRPVAGIELDDRSHEAEDRQRRDAFVDHVFQSCKIPLLHVPARATYAPSELQSSITAILARGANEAAG